MGIWNWFIRDEEGVGALELVRVANGRGSFFLLIYVFFSITFVSGRRFRIILKDEQISIRICVRFCDSCWMVLRDCIYTPVYQRSGITLFPTHYRENNSKY